MRRLNALVGAVVDMEVADEVETSEVILLEVQVCVIVHRHLDPADVRGLWAGRITKSGIGASSVDGSDSVSGSRRGSTESDVLSKQREELRKTIRDQHRGDTWQIGPNPNFPNILARGCPDECGNPWER